MVARPVRPRRPGDRPLRRGTGRQPHRHRQPRTHRHQPHVARQRHRAGGPQGALPRLHRQGLRQDAFPGSVAPGTHKPATYEKARSKKSSGLFSFPLSVCRERPLPLLNCIEFNETSLGEPTSPRAISPNQSFPAGHPSSFSMRPLGPGLLDLSKLLSKPG